MDTDTTQTLQVEISCTHLHFCEHGTDIQELVGVQPSNRRPSEVSDIVHPSHEGCQAHVFDLVNDVGGILQCDSSELDVGSSCDISTTLLAVWLDAVSKATQLLR